MNEQEEISQFQSDLRSFEGRAIEFFTRLIGRVENFFGWPASRKAKIKQEAEENFKTYSAKITTEEKGA